MKKSSVYAKLFALSLASSLSLTNPEVAKAGQNDSRTEVTYYSVPMVTATTKVNLRESASLNSKVVGTLDINQSLRLYEEYDQFYKVGYGNTYAYVAKQYVVQTNKTIMDSPSIKTISLPNSVTMYKDEACTSYLATIPANTTVSVYLDNANTYYIYYNNQVGYINKQYNNKNNVNNYDYKKEFENGYYEVTPYYGEPLYNYNYNYNYDPYYYNVPQTNQTQNNIYYGPVDNNYNYYYYEVYNDPKVLKK